MRVEALETDLLEDDLGAVRLGEPERAAELVRLGEQDGGHGAMPFFWSYIPFPVVLTTSFVAIG